MYKLLIVEDEKLEREGLVDFLAWPELDIEIVGTAANGVQGMELAREYLPDIVITDIRMPKMDGMEFSKQIKQLIPDCKVIIITGYDDFEYAREAIQLGVYDFLLKPIQKAELLEVLDKTVRCLSHERERADYAHTLKLRLDESVYNDRERLLIDVVGGNYEYPDDRKIMKSCNITSFDKGFAAVVIKFDNFNFFRDKEPAERQSYLRELYRRIRMAIGSEGITAQNSAVMNEIILCLPAGEGDRKHIYDIIRRIEQTLQEEDHPEAVTGVGAVVKTLRRFRESYLQAEAALDNLFFIYDSGTLFFEDIVRREGTRDPEDYSFFTSAAGYSKKILRCVVSADAVEITALLEELFDFIKANACDKSLIFNFLTGLLSELSVLLLSSDYTLDVPWILNGDLLETLSTFIRLEDMKKWFMELLLNSIDLISDKKDNKDDYIVGKVIDIIRKEYKDSIGIEIIAARLEYSPNYLGALFSKYTGKRFTEYLMDFRMKKAEELLASEMANVGYTAREVGFVNAAHFCTVFRKTHGISPMDYHKKCLQESAKHE